MPDFSALETAMHRALLLAAGVCGALLLMTLASLAFAFSTAGAAQESRTRMPILVVPGSIGGVYTPGITEDNVRATARYLTSLATNFGGARSFQERFDELEGFASPAYLPLLQQARRSLLHDVETQGQARSFFASPSSEQLEQNPPGHFTYRVRGERVVYAGGITMDRRASEARLQLEWGTPTTKNRVGVLLDGFRIQDIAAGTPGEPAPSHPQAPTP